MSLGQWTFSIALGLYAYYEEGAGGVALAVAARMLPAALLGPLADRLSASLGPRTVLGGTALARFALLELVALVVWKELPFPLLLTLAAGFELAGSVQRPARTAMLIGIARSPGELAAASAGRFTDYVGFLAGGLLAGLLVAGSGLDVAFAVAGAAYLAGAATFFTLPAQQRVAAAPRRSQGRAAARDPWLRIRVALFGASTLVQAMLELLLVVTALDVLAMGSGGVGWLRAAFAFGGIAGAAAAVALLRRGRFALGLATGLALAGVPLALVPALPRAAPALVLLALLGGGYALLEAALLFLTQRLAAPAALARLAALEELVYPLARAAGAGIAALLVVQLGDTAALLVAGALLPLAALASMRALRRAEQRAAVPEDEFRLLRG